MIFFFLMLIFFTEKIIKKKTIVNFDMVVNKKLNLGSAYVFQNIFKKFA